jgi:phosphatidate phosphatase APP1
VSSALHLVEREGLTIVSDVDDTVKVSEVRDKRALLRRTFLQAFEAVPNMGPKYTTWLGAEPSGTGHLHFVSSSPWQLFEPLHTLMGASGFAPATYDLKRIRPREIPTTAEELLADPRTTKPPAIRSVMERFPKRKFVLVGDSGERDPEVYGVIGRERPDQIVRIYIRDVTGEKRDDARYRSAFEGIPAEQWILFDDASKLPDTP